MSSQHLACSVPAHHLSNCQPLPLCHRHVSGMLLSPLQGSKWIHSHHTKWNVSKSSGFPLFGVFYSSVQENGPQPNLGKVHSKCFFGAAQAVTANYGTLWGMFKKRMDFFHTGFVQKLMQFVHNKQTNFCLA